MWFPPLPSVECVLIDKILLLLEYRTLQETPYYLYSLTQVYGALRVEYKTRVQFWEDIKLERAWGSEGDFFSCGLKHN